MNPRTLAGFSPGNPRMTSKSQYPQPLRPRPPFRNLRTIRSRRKGSPEGRWTRRYSESRPPTSGECFCPALPRTPTGEALPGHCCADLRHHRSPQRQPFGDGRPPLVRRHRQNRRCGQRCGLRKVDSTPEHPGAPIPGSGGAPEVHPRETPGNPPPGFPGEPSPEAALLPDPLREPLRPGDYGATGGGGLPPGPSYFAGPLAPWEKLLLGLLTILLAAVAALGLLAQPALEPPSFDGLQLEPGADPNLFSPEELRELRRCLPSYRHYFREEPYHWTQELLLQADYAAFRELLDGETLDEVRWRHRNYLVYLDKFLLPWARTTAPGDMVAMAEHTYLRHLSINCAQEKRALLELPPGALRNARLRLMDDWYRELEARYLEVDRRVNLEMENPTPSDILSGNFSYQRY